MAHLVLFASEQTIPNLMAVELVRRTRPNKPLQVHIYTTSSSEKSIVPGEKLKWLIEDKRAGEVVDIGPKHPIESPGPDEIRAYLSELMHESNARMDFVCLKRRHPDSMTYGFLGMPADPRRIYF